MSVERCMKCEENVDTDYELGDYCCECNAFLCMECIDEIAICPSCGSGLD